MINNKHVYFPVLILYYHIHSRDLLLSCWSYEADRRPLVSTLLDKLKTSPDVVEPCLDAPRSAVSIDASSSVNVALPRARHRSTPRTTSEHSQLHTFHSDSRSFPHSPTSSVPPDPFSILNSSSDKDSRGKRFSQSSVIKTNLGSNSRGPGAAGDVSDSLGDADITGGPSASRSSKNMESVDGCDNHPTTSSSSSSGCSAVESSTSSFPHSGSPPSSLQLKLVCLPAALEERVDSDYGSDNSKDYWHNATMSAV